ncbi:major facilitator superfamily domain-containing protein [Aspergillus pseudotamarii]|uniref:Major facilitator superfamily domain-containing protein n=1 Tax=Aspergillus pseudotamarii TaxID=132259 RepID=A0A5N6SEC3_ASPPS|nr:major facilitator superfamily domain-containing protein [Aspergillus pseudotamarii]KAE8132031.1 major facilitator superfamily domain-containing protein [Aspergillus pseudotamarii]
MKPSTSGESDRTRLEPTDEEVAKLPSQKFEDEVVDWNGPDDPDNPLNWSTAKSFGHVVIVAVLSMVVNIASTMVAPAMEGVVRDLEITSRTLGTLAVSIYLLGFALGPLFISSLSEMYGRLIVYHISNAVFVIFVVACALSHTPAQFLVFRFINGCAGAAPLALGGGTIADVIPVEKRGAAAALFGLGPLLGPVLGPVIGGFIAEGKSWRWTFWVVAILGGAASLGTLIFMRETHPNTLLERKAAYLRRSTGNPRLRSKLDRGLSNQQIILTSLVRPTKLLLFSPIVLVMSIYVALIFGLLYLLFATFSMVFEGQYGFSTGISGLAYLGLGIGELVGLFTFGILSDRILKAKMAAENVQEPKPEYRLVLMMWFPPVIGPGLFIYGWTAYYQVHWMVPIVGTFIVGFGSFFVIMPSQLYLVDLFGSEAAASALGANILLRSLFGAFLPLAGSHMYATLNYGWGNTLLGFLALVFAPVPMLFYRYGEWLRSRTTVRL